MSSIADYDLGMTLNNTGGSAAERPSLSAAERAYIAISNAILAGDFKEGEFLDEKELSARVGTSRTPVREALRQLHEQRFIDILPRRGAQVHVISARELKEIYSTRLVLEAHAIGEIINLGLGVPAGIDELAEAILKHGERGDWVATAEADQRFHAAFVEHTGNEVLASLFDSLRPRQIRLSVRTISTAPDRLSTIHQEHTDLLRAVNNRDFALARATLEAHLSQVPDIMNSFQA